MFIVNLVNVEGGLVLSCHTCQNFTNSGLLYSVAIPALVMWGSLLKTEWGSSQQLFQFCCEWGFSKQASIKAN